MVSENRMEEIVKHLVGTRLQLSSVLTERERNNCAAMRALLARLKVDPETARWITS